MSSISDIREKDNPARDKSKRRATPSTMQRQMMQKFITELNHTTKQSEAADSAENAATEQLETTTREIVHEAVQLPRRAIQHPARKESAGSSANVQPEQPTHPHHTPESPRERTDTARTRPDATLPQSAPTPAPQEQARRAYVRQVAKTTRATPTGAPEQVQEPAIPFAENVPRLRTNDVCTRSKPKQLESAPAPTPQEQARRAHAKQAKKSRAEKPSARDNLYTEQPEIRPADDWPDHEPPPIREKPDIPEIRGQVRSEAAPAKPAAIHHVKQPNAWTSRSAAASVMRGGGQSVRERSAVTPAHDLTSAPQEQARQAFAEKQAQLSQNPSIESVYPSEQTAPFLPQPPVSDAPTIVLERQPVTAGCKPVSVQTVPPEIQPPSSPMKHLSIREKPTPNAAPREASRRGVPIRTRDAEQISAPKNRLYRKP